MFLLILFIVPIIAALFCLAVKKEVSLLETITSIAAPIELVSAIIIAANVFWKGRYTYNTLFSIDSLGTIVLLTIVFIGFASAFYSIGYLREEVKKQIIGFHRVKEYFILFHLFLAAMFLAVVTTSPILTWIAIEATTLSTAFLISFYNKPTAMEAAWKYLTINSIGLLLGFFGTLLFLTSTSNLAVDKLVDWQTLSMNAVLFNPLIAKIAFIFVLIGYGTKAGLAPMHTWLPDAHSKAPPPISALLSGALLNVAMMVILRYKAVTDIALGTSFSQNLMIFFGVISIIIPAFIIITQKNYKRLFAYSSIEHMGIMALGFGFGGIGTFGALLHMIYHSLTKSVLFFSAGNMFLKYSSTKIANVKGVLVSLPVTGVILIMGFLSIVGVPPFGIFMTEFYILSAGMIQNPVISTIVIICLAIIFVGFLKHIVGLVFNKDELVSLPIGEFNYFTIVPAIFLISLLFAGSFFLPVPIKTFIESAAVIIH